MGYGPPSVLSFQAPQMLVAELFVNVETSGESHDKSHAVGVT